MKRVTAAMTLPAQLRAWLPVAGMGAGVILAGLLCLSMGLRWQRLREDVASARDAYARYQAVVSQREAIERTVTAYHDALAVSASEDVAMRAFLGRLQAAAQASGLQVISIKPQPTQRTSDTVTYLVEMAGSATGPALAQFLHALEYGPALHRVIRLRVYADPKTAGQVQVQVAVTHAQLL